jgi:hypothetical protein
MRYLILFLIGCAGSSGPPSDGSNNGDDTSNTDATEACNGHVELCDRRFDEVSMVVTHNAMSSAERDWSFPNQNLAVPTQLADGVRGFMLDTHYDGDATALCHSFCLLGSTPLDEGLAEFTTFLDANPREVLGFMIQNGISAEDTVTAFDAADLTRYTYAHEPGAPWPTLEEMIAADTRLVVFHEGGGTGPDWYMDGYADFVWDTPYSAETVDDFSCGTLRGDAGHDLFLVNHFLTAPLASEELATEANAIEMLRDRVERCEAEAGQHVNWLAVDFYDVGGTLQVVDELNGVTD